MRYLVIIFFIIISFNSNSQSKIEDLRLMEFVSTSYQKENKDKKSFFKGILKFYHNHISDQIINDCIYQESCSTFGQGAFHEYGMIKGTFLTTDRMMRCNGLSRSQILPVRFNEFGKISDHWLDYGKKK